MVDAKHFHFHLFISFIVPNERLTILKENFNRWYSVKSYYYAITIIDLPISFTSCFLFSLIIYVMTGWPLEVLRFTVFFVVSLLVVLIAQTVGLIIGSVFNVIVSRNLNPACLIASSICSVHFAKLSTRIL